MKLLKEGKVYKDDIGQCWPAGLPLIMTRYWPMAMIQLPTAIYMVSEFMNSVRTIYLDGRQHTDPDIVVRTFNGESIGRWEGRHAGGGHDRTSAAITTGWIRAARRFRRANSCASSSASAWSRRQAARDRVHDDRPGALGRRVEEHQALQPGQRRGHPGSVVPAGPERAPAEHDVEDAGSAGRWSSGSGQMSE